MGDLKELEKIDEKSKLTTDGDTAKIKFQHSTNGEAKIEMPEAGAVGFQCGLTKEELMKYANDPFWVVLRRVLLVLFWLLWIAMLAGAVAIIIVTPGCAAPKEPEWPEISPVYEIHVDKFYGENGKPNLKGVRAKLPYLEDISVSTVVLDKLFNPANQRVMQPEIGSFEDFGNLTERVKVLVKIPLSEVPLDTEDNQRNFATTLDFWLKKGAAGFVFDEIELVPNSVGISKLIKGWREMISNSSTEGSPRVTMLSAYGKKLEEEEYCAEGTFILNYGLTELKKGFSADEFFEKFQPTTEKNRTTCRENLVLSNGDISPLLTRFSPQERDRIIMFSLLADATPFVFFGEEYARDDPDLPSTLQRQKSKQPAEMKWNRIEEFSKLKTNNFYQVFAKTSEIRNKNSAIQIGDTHLKVLNGTVVAMSRIKRSMPGYAVVTNFEKTPKTVSLLELGDHIPEHGDKDVVSSGSETVKGKQDFRELIIGGEETKVFHFVPKFG